MKFAQKQSLNWNSDEQRETTKLENSEYYEASARTIHYLITSVILLEMAYCNIGVRLEFHLPVKRVS